MSCMQEALSLYEKRMTSQELIPDTITFNALIRAVGRSRRPDLAGRAAHYFTTLSELGLHPDKYTFSAFFNAAHHCKLSDGSFLLHVRANEPAIERFFLFVLWCRPPGDDQVARWSCWETWNGNRLSACAGVLRDATLRRAAEQPHHVHIPAIGLGRTIHKAAGGASVCGGCSHARPDAA